MLRGVDRAAFAVAFAGRLRAAGVRVGLSAVEQFVRALDAVPPARRERLYWTARITLVRDVADLARFDAVFEAVFADATLALDPHARRGGPGAAGDPADRNLPVPRGDAEPEAGEGLPWATLPPAVAVAEEPADTGLAVPERLPAALVGQADTPFDELDAEQLRLLRDWLEHAARRWPTRRARRQRLGATGPRVALRPTVARARRTAWEPVELVRSRSVDEPRRVVMLCDVSESMRAQATAYLHLMRALTLRRHGEVFAFATSLTRLTPVLSRRSAAEAVEQATERVTDRFGGTRIATCVQELLSSRHGGAVRGAVVIIGSDGWDSDPPERLAAAMARLHRRAHRVVWINPRAGAPGFEPRVAAMASALPWVDALLPGDTVASLVRALEAVEALSSRASRGSRAGTARR